MSVRWKLILAVGVPILIFSVIAIAWDSSRLRQAAVDATAKQFEQLVARYAAEIDGRFDTIAQVSRSTASFVETTPDISEAELYELLRRNVEQNDLVYGSCIAYEPGAFGGRRLFAPYVYHGPHAPITQDGRIVPDGRPLLRMDVADAYDYTDPKWAWFRVPRETGKAGWTEPFFDEGAGDVAMVTFVAPFFHDGRFRGTVNMDVRLEQLTARVSRIGIPDADVAIISPTGMFISFPVAAFVMKRSIFDLARENGVESLELLGRRMLAGRSGMMTVAQLDAPEPHLIFYTPIRSAGWSLAAAIPEASVMAPVNAQLRVRALVLAIAVVSILGMVMLLGMYITRPLLDLAAGVRELAAGRLDARVANLKRRDEVGQLAAAFNTMTADLRRHVDALNREAAARQAVESELRVARTIQASMLPRVFPGGEAYRIFGLSAPAKYVGGDFFDCFETANGELAVVIGDVSGKGVPAAMFMAMVRTTIRDLVREESSPAVVLTRANELLIQSNEQGMFVTIFLGRYAPGTGRMRFANGGHLPPYILSTAGTRRAGQSTGTVVGVLDEQRFGEGELELRPREQLFLYTDGVTEARSPSGELFSEDRLAPFLSLHRGANAEELCRLSVAAVDDFQDRVLADDVTVMVLERGVG
jgi:sigma-B regulation protein RsbU (phosphoserine phosphatase)